MHYFENKKIIYIVHIKHKMSSVFFRIICTIGGDYLKERIYI